MIDYHGQGYLCDLLAELVAIQFGSGCSNRLPAQNTCGLYNTFYEQCGAVL
jgi:hypothetical protein